MADEVRYNRGLLVLECGLSWNSAALNPHHLHRRPLHPIPLDEARSIIPHFQVHRLDVLCSGLLSPPHLHLLRRNYALLLRHDHHPSLLNGHAHRRDFDSYHGHLLGLPLHHGNRTDWWTCKTSACLLLLVVLPPGDALFLLGVSGLNRNSAWVVRGDSHGAGTCDRQHSSTNWWKSHLMGLELSTLESTAARTSYSRGAKGERRTHRAAWCRDRGE